MYIVQLHGGLRIKVLLNSACALACAKGMQSVRHKGLCLNSWQRRPLCYP